MIYHWFGPVHFTRLSQPSARERFAEVIRFTCGIVVRDVDVMTLTKSNNSWVG